MALGARSGRSRHAATPPAGRDRSAVLYELNEVPWSIVDLYVEARPDSHLAHLVRDGLSLTTVNEDPVPLQPWRTWPTLHTSTYTDEHNSFELGQDPDTFRGVPIWDAADAAGLPVGLFGPLQSWPARQFRSGGFYVPDTFSRSSETYPPALERFQAFNLRMTRDNAFSSDRDPSVGQMAAVGIDLVRRGLTPASMATLTVQLARELNDARYKARRPAMQVLPSFDLYWSLHRHHKPRLSVFFTNHVAGMMHRYWGDWVPEYAEVEPYEPDEVFSKFVLTSMDMADRHFGRIRRYMAEHPETVLIVAASMGQAGIPYRAIDRTFVLEDGDRLLNALGLPGAEAGLAMYPRISFEFDDGDGARDSVTSFTSVMTGASEPMFDDFTVNGRTVSFEINYRHPDAKDDEPLTFTPNGGSPQQGTPGDLGIVVRRRLGGGNTAYHIPEGMFLAYGAGIPVDPGRSSVSVLDVAPSILTNLLHVPAPRTMRGQATLFRAMATA